MCVCVDAHPAAARAALPVMVLVPLRKNNKILVLLSPVNWEMGRGGTAGSQLISANQWFLGGQEE